MYYTKYVHFKFLIASIDADYIFIRFLNFRCFRSFQTKFNKVYATLYLHYSEEDIIRKNIYELILQ